MNSRMTAKWVVSVTTNQMCRRRQEDETSSVQSDSTHQQSHDDGCDGCQPETTYCRQNSTVQFTHQNTHTDDADTANRQTATHSSLLHCFLQVAPIYILAATCFTTLHRWYAIVCQWWQSTFMQVWYSEVKLSQWRQSPNADILTAGQHMNHYASSVLQYDQLLKYETFLFCCVVAAVSDIHLHHYFVSYMATHSRWYYIKLHFYRQHCAQCNAPIFKLAKGRF